MTSTAVPPCRYPTFDRLSNLAVRGAGGASIIDELGDAVWVRCNRVHHHAHKELVLGGTHRVLVGGVGGWQVKLMS
jgi:hypothetical protein